MSAENDYMTVVEATRALGVSIDNTYRLLYAGKLKAEKVEGKWHIDRTAVMERIERKRAQTHAK